MGQKFSVSQKPATFEQAKTSGNITAKAQWNNVKPNQICIVGMGSKN